MFWRLCLSSVLSSGTVDKTHFSQQLIKRTITYFNRKYGFLLSEEEAIEALHKFAELHGLLSFPEPEAGLFALRQREQKADRREG